MKKRIAIMGISMALLMGDGCKLFNAKSSTLPTFNLLMLDSTTIFNTASIPGGSPVIFVFISPDCSHCQAETASILENMDSLKDVRFCFLTIDPIERLRVFKDYYNIPKYPNIILGRDYTWYFPNHFRGLQPPYTVVFDRDKMERAVFGGQTNAHKLLAFLRVM